MPIKQCENCSIAIGGRPRLDDNTRYVRVELLRHRLRYKNGDYSRHDIMICSVCMKLLESRGYIRKDFGGTSRIIFKNRFAINANTERFEKLINGRDSDWRTIRERLNNQYYRA